ncbi:MAG TPA: hypothetical protein VNO56_10600 [Gaiellaceae bacterium]|nr:hypothetical protein [Gaiellaceae bacterium]
MPRVPRVAFLLVPLLAFAVLGGGFALWQHLRESRADGLAVKYGIAASEDEATLADRCTGVMREEYNRSDDPRKAGLPPKVEALLSPKMCALGVQRGLVEDDGTMSEEAGEELSLAVIEQMGVERFQTLLFDELAVTQYHLAKAGEVTRWDRCVAMGYSGWDAQLSKDGLPPRETFRRAIRSACTIGIERGIVPASGAPPTDSPEGAALQQLMLETFVEVSAP